MYILYLDIDSDIVLSTDVDILSIIFFEDILAYLFKSLTFGVNDLIMSF